MARFLQDVVAWLRASIHLWRCLRDREGWIEEIIEEAEEVPEATIEPREAWLYMPHPMWMYVVTAKSEEVFELPLDRGSRLSIQGVRLHPEECGMLSSRWHACQGGKR